VRRTFGVNVHIRVGLNSGEVLVRSIGSDLRMDYSAVGQTTHLAARMEQLAQPGSTLMTSQVLDLVAGYVDARPLGPVAVKGMPQPVAVHELVGAGQVRTRFQAAAARGLSPFVGRADEIDHLGRALDAAGRGQGRIVGVAGEAGVGKSRLLFEFTRTAEAQGWRVLQADSISHSRSVPYLPIVGILKSYFEIDERDTPESARNALASKLMALDPGQAPALPILATLLGVGGDDLAPALASLQRRRLIPDAVKRILLRESQVRPLLLVVENLHWIDAESQALLDSLIDSLPGARILLVVNFRPEYRHEWGGRGHYSQIQVQPLSATSADELLDSLLGTDAGLEPVKQFLIERTGGNPFFLEETVHTLVETGALAGERHARRLAVPLGAIQVPATVQAVIAERADRLPADGKRLLQCAAVVGKTIPLTLLGDIADLGEEDLLRWLAQLTAGEYLFESALFPEVEYSFKHALTQSVAYRSLPEERRRGLHARIVDTIEARYPERANSDVDELGHHAFHGQLWERACGYLHRAGLKALTRSAYHDAAARFEQALTAVVKLPEDPERTRRRLDLLLQLRDALLPLGEYERGREHLREAERLAHALGDGQQLGWIAVYLTNYAWLTADHEYGLESGRRAVALADATDDFGLQIASRMRLAQIHYALGDCAASIRVSEDILGRLDASHEREHFSLPGAAPIWARTWLAFALAEIGDFARAETMAAEALAMAEPAGHSYSILFSAGALALVWLQQDHVARAVPLIERVYTVCETCSFTSAIAWITSALSAGYAASGRAGETRERLATAIEQSAANSILWSHSAAVMTLANELLLSGEADAAFAPASEAVRCARERGERSVEAQALRVLAAVLEALGRDAEAEDAYSQALARAEAGGLRPLQARCVLARGALRRRVNRLESAYTDLALANKLCRALGLGHLVSQIDAELQAFPAGTGAPPRAHGGTHDV
jgi:tetratricopeptide (TPR) repeat protein